MSLVVGAGRVAPRRRPGSLWAPHGRVDDAWARFNTLGHVAALEGEAKERIHEAFTHALTEGVERDDDGKVVLHGNTWAVWTMKIPADGADGLADVPSS